MKNMRKLLLVASILTGLVFFAACDDPLDKSGVDPSRDVSAQAGEDTGGLPGEDPDFDEEGYLWLSVFNGDGSMENIRVPVCKKAG